MNTRVNDLPLSTPMERGPGGEVQLYDWQGTHQARQSRVTSADYDVFAADSGALRRRVQQDEADLYGWAHPRQEVAGQDYSPFDAS